MTLKVVVLPAPLGPIRPVMWPAYAVMSALLTAVTPPKRTVTSSTDRTGTVSSTTGSASSLARDAGKASLLEVGGRRAPDRTSVARSGRTPGPAQPFDAVLDAGGEPVGVASDADPGQSRDQVAQLR